MIDLKDCEDWQATTNDKCPPYIIQIEHVNALITKFFPNKEKHEQAALEREQHYKEALKCLE